MPLSGSENLQKFRAPLGRDSADQLHRKNRLATGSPLVQTLLDAMPGIVMILNGNRQVVAANRPLLDLVGGILPDLLGRRFGEVLGCSYWHDGPDGCGTGPQCENCGAHQAIRQCQATHNQTSGQCELVIDQPIKGAALELRVKATPMSLEGEEFIVCALEDIRSQNRLSVLNRLFFHDVLNLLGGLQGNLELLAEALPSGQQREDARRLCWLADQLVDEVQAQRELMLAEAGDLEVQPQAVRTRAIVEDLQLLYSAHAAGAQRTIDTSDTWDGVLVTDLRLLARVLGNMLRNALEATKPGGRVSIRCIEGATWVEFSVHNVAAIAKPLQRQIFRRAFSTKGQTVRGMGLRSIKLLGESYLQGAVGFSSAEGEGTTFTLRIPKVLQPREDQEPGRRSRHE